MHAYFLKDYASIFILAASFFVLLTNQLIQLKIFIMLNIAKCAIIK